MDTNQLVHRYGQTYKFTLRNRPDLARIIKAGFPSYKKRDAYVSPFKAPQPISSYWDGGSRDEYRVVNIVTGEAMGTPTSHPFFDVAARGLANQTDGVVHTDRVGNVELLVLPLGYALVAAGTFCGKPATAHLYLPEEITCRLPADPEWGICESLTDLEQTVCDNPDSILPARVIRFQE